MRVTVVTPEIRPSAVTVNVGIVRASPFVPAVTPVVESVGLGYVPANDPPAAPEGGPPSDAPQTTSVPFDWSTWLAAPRAKRFKAGVPSATKMSPRASGVVVPTAAPFSFATVGLGYVPPRSPPAAPDGG